eukprot:5135003-Heterocapsa_arctica.AAC.1
MYAYAFTAVSSREAWAHSGILRSSLCLLPDVPIRLELIAGLLHPQHTERAALKAEPCVERAKRKCAYLHST